MRVRETIERHSLEILVPKEIQWEITLFEMDGLSLILNAGRFDRYAESCN